MPFEARELPTVVWIRDEAIAGPFCIHCGWPFSLHSDDMRCPINVFALLGPSCECHEIREVEVTKMEPVHGRQRRRKVTRTVKRIARKRSLR